MTSAPIIINDFNQVIEVPDCGIIASGETQCIPGGLQEDLERILLSKKCLANRLEIIADQVARDFKEGIFAVVVLKGAIIFFADLMRALAERGISVEFDVSVVASYENAETTGKINIRLDVEEDIANKDVLIVEDIIDTGMTLDHLREYFLRERGARNVRICTFLDKIGRRRKEINVDYIGFRVPDYFLVGYGLDYNQKYRFLPYVAILNPKIYQK
jgi:hypoxanthine phosphoribosyltransferase